MRNQLYHSVIALFAIILIPSYSTAQKVKIKDNIATIDGEDYVKVINPFGVSEVSVYELGGDDELIYMVYKSYNDPTKVSSGNPQGAVRWVEIKFLTLSVSCEVQSRMPKKLIKLLYENSVFVDGKLNEENAMKFVEKYGAEFSKNKPESVIIINR